MPRQSTDFVEVIYLDNAAAVAALKKTAEALIASNANVIRVYLFGSLAEGTATPESDADIMIIVREAEGRFFDRGDDYLKYFDRANLEIGIQFFVYTVEEIDSMLKSGNDFIKTVVASGLILSERK
jgi:predicted nucleotidyltransferase